MKISYEKYKWNNKIGIGLFYLLFGSILFALQEIVIQYFHQGGLFWSRFVVTYTFATIIPLVVIWASHSIYQMFLNLDNVLVFPIEIQDWSNDRIKKTFSYSTWQSKFCAVAATLGLITIILSSSFQAPYNSTQLNFAILLLLTPIMFIAGHSAFALLASMFTIYKLAELPVKQKFYRAGDTETLEFTKWCSTMILTVVALYLLFLLALKLTPYFFEPVTIIWMVISGFFPSFLYDLVLLSNP